MNVAGLEAECIVFAAEGLLLAHDFTSGCGIRVQFSSESVSANTLSALYPYT
jgi:hypothetical protein